MAGPARQRRDARRDGRVAQGDALIMRLTSQGVTRVRIPLPPLSIMA